MIERLSRQVLNLWGRREGKSWVSPSAAPRGHMVCLINGYAGSGGDAFPYYFREEGIGPLIGTTTWGGLVGYSRGITLMDGGFISMPDFGFINLKGQWDVERIGVKPDIEVDNLPEEAAKGRDQQLEKGIEVVMERIRQNPPKLPEKPRVSDQEVSVAGLRTHPRGLPARRRARGKGPSPKEGPFYWKTRNATSFPCYPASFIAIDDANLPW